MALGGALGGIARVVLRVDDGDFGARLRADSALLGSTTQQMSRHLADLSSNQIRAKLAAESYNKAVIRSGEDSTAAARALLRLRSAEESLRTQTVGTSTGMVGLQSHLHGTEQEANRTVRGILSGSGAFSHLGRSIAFASTAFLGAAGFTSVVRGSVSAAEELGKAHRGLDAQLIANNDNLRAAVPLVAAVDTKMASFGHTAAESQTALSRLARATGDVDKAAGLMTLTADLSAAKQISLEQAALLVGKVFDGNVSALNRYGIHIEKGTSVTDALRIAQQKLAGQAAAAVTPMEKLHAAVFNIEAVAGEQLLPTINRIAVALTHWTSQTKNQERVQRDVAHAVKLGGEAVHGLKDAYDVLAPPVRLVSRLLGGAENTVKLLGVAFVGLKLRALIADLGLTATGIRGVGAAAATATPEVAGFAAAEAAAGAAGLGGGVAGAAGVAARVGMYTGAAWSGATTAASAAGGIGAKVLGSTLGRLAFGVGWALAQRGESGTVSHLGGPLDVTVSAIPGGSDAYIIYTDPVDRKKRFLGPVGRGTNIADAIAADIAKHHPPTVRNDPGRDFPAHQGVQAPAAPARRGRPAPLSREARIQLAISTAETGVARGNKGAQDAALHAYQQQVAYDRDYEAKQERLIRLGIGDRKSHLKILQGLQADEQSTLGQIQSIQDGRAQDAKKAADKAKATADKAKAAVEKRARDREKALHDAIQLRERHLKNQVARAELTKGTLADDRKALRDLIAFDKDEEHNMRLTASERASFVTKELAARKQLAALGKTATSTGAGAQIREFLQSFMQLQSDYASNVKPTVHVHQHFPHPPTMPPYREAIFARAAVGSAFDS
jgi:hypothetical protein